LLKYQIWQSALYRDEQTNFAAKLFSVDGNALFSGDILFSGIIAK